MAAHHEEASLLGQQPGDLEVQEPIEARSLAPARRLSSYTRVGGIAVGVAVLLLGTVAVSAWVGASSHRVSVESPGNEATVLMYPYKHKNSTQAPGGSPCAPTADTTTPLPAAPSPAPVAPAPAPTPAPAAAPVGTTACPPISPCDTTTNGQMTFQAKNSGANMGNVTALSPAFQKGIAAGLGVPVCDVAITGVKPSARRLQPMSNMPVVPKFIVMFIVRKVYTTEALIAKLELNRVTIENVINQALGALGAMLRVGMPKPTPITDGASTTKKEGGSRDLPTVAPKPEPEPEPEPEAE